MKRLMLLRDIIDLDATYSALARTLPLEASARMVTDSGPQAAAIKAQEENPEEKKERDKASSDDEGVEEGESTSDDEDENDEDDDENTVSLAVMEQALLPDVLSKFDAIKKTYAKVNRAQTKRLATISDGEKVSPAMEKRIGKLRHELVDLMDGIHLNNNRIDYLVGHMYDLNRKLIGLEGRLLRMAVSGKVKRADFLEQYYGNELDPNWLSRVSRLTGKGWKLLKRTGMRSKTSITEIAEIANEVRNPIAEFRRIVATVQKANESAKAKKEMIEAISG